MEFVYYIHQNVSRGTTTAHTTFTGERREGVHKQFIILVTGQMYTCDFYSSLLLVIFAVPEGRAEGYIM